MKDKSNVPMMVALVLLPEGMLGVYLGRHNATHRRAVYVYNESWESGSVPVHVHVSHGRVSYNRVVIFVVLGKL